MNGTSDFTNRRVLVIDDNKAIHEDFRKILTNKQGATALDAAAQADGFELHSAYQGQEGLDLVRQAITASRPYAMAFVDMRMPPGWDGMETISRIWRMDLNIGVVICTAYSEHSWRDIAAKLGTNDHLFILKKPFDVVEARQLACALTEKWKRAREARRKHDKLDRFSRSQSIELDRRRKKLVRSEGGLRTLMERAPDGIISVRDNGVIEAFNPAAENIFDYRAHEIVGRDISTLIPSLASRGRHAGLHQYLKPNDDKLPARGVEVQGRSKDGHEIPLALSLGRFRTDEGASFVGIVRDITEQKRMAEIERECNRLKEAAGMPPPVGPTASYSTRPGRFGAAHSIPMERMC